MCCANLKKRICVLRTIKKPGRIGTSKREIVPLGQFVPKLFETNGRVDLSVGPEQSDHFAEHGEAQISSSRRLVGSKKDSVQNLGKAMLVRLIFDHERAESLGRIQGEISFLFDCT